MPTLHWIGKEKVINHHLEVPFRVLDHSYGFDNGKQVAEETGSGNKIIHGDNLEALKALLPEYEGRIKCIYIDPPYNTGNEGWVYNDNVNDPKIKKWLQQVVGKEGEDLSRHDKWLCMIYPRLKLLHKLLADDGAIFVSIDDVEQSHLRLVLDEVFGAAMFVTSVIWEKADSPRNSARQFSTDHDFVLVYSKNQNWTPNKLKRTEEANSIYKNPDNDPKGDWIPGDPFANKPYSKGLYQITGPTGRTFSPPAGRFWRISEEKFQELNAEGKIWWGPTGNARPSIKRYVNEVSDLVPRTLWRKDDVGSNRSSKNEMRALFPNENSFDTPKPVKLLERVLEIGADNEAIVLDSFAGSATTAHAVLNLNKHDGGTRRFICIEMEDYAETITAERVKRVIKGYAGNEGTGGSFDFYTLGQPLFMEDGNLNEAAGIAKIRAYVWYTETGQPLEEKAYEDSPTLLGQLNGTAYYFHYQPEDTTALDHAFLNTLKTKAAQYVIYADNCLLPPEYLAKHKIFFKKIPRDLSKF